MHEPGEVQCRCGSHLLLEALQEGRVLSEALVEDLHRDAAAQREVVGKIDAGVGASAHELKQPVALSERAAHRDFSAHRCYRIGPLARALPRAALILVALQCHARSVVRWQFIGPLACALR